MDYTPNSRRLSDISHLFLSDVRKKQTGHDNRPARTPPGGFKGDVSVDLTPEEFANMMAAPSASDPTFKPLRAVVAHHLGETLADRVRDLAATVSNGAPVGIVYADAGAVRVCFVDPAHSGADAEEAVSEPLSVQRLREVLVELDEDVCEWLLVLPDHRSADTQALMAQAKEWTLLTTADHEGVVAAYRALKTVCGEARPKLTVNVFGSSDAAETEKSARKLAGVCEQFLKVGLTIGPALAESSAREVCLLEAVSESGGEDHWPVLAALADGAAEVAERPAPTPVVPTAVERPSVSLPIMRSMPAPAEPVAEPVASPKPAAPTMSIVDDTPAVIELPDTDASLASILNAVVGNGGEWMDSPVKAPGLPDARVAIAYDGRITLVAVAKPGLGDWRALAAGLKWMAENRSLIAMAVPHLKADASAEPRLHVLVDHAELADVSLHPLLAVGNVTVAGYRKLRWGGRVGLLLEAA